MPVEQPSGVLAILLGASTFPNAPKLAEGRAFYISAADVREYLGDEQGLNLPRRNVLSLFDDSRSPSDQLMEVANFLVRRALELKNDGVRADDLLIYYVGHGLFTRGDQAYCLAIRSTNEINEGATSIRAGDLAGVIKENAAFLRRYLILDCCFAASIHREFQSGALTAAAVQVANEFPKRGTALLCSSNAHEPSLAPQGLEHTMFSHALVQVLRKGNQAAGPRLSFSELGSLIQENLRSAYPDGWVRPEVHSPDQREGDIAHIPLFPNHAFVDSVEEQKRQAEERLKQAERERAREEQERQERERAEAIAKERIAAEKAAAEREAAQRAEQARIAREAEAERAAKEAEAKRIAAEKAATERARKKAEHEREKRERAEAAERERIAAEKAAAKSEAARRAQQERIEREAAEERKRLEISTEKTSWLSGKILATGVVFLGMVVAGIWYAMHPTPPSPTPNPIQTPSSSGQQPAGDTERNAEAHKESSGTASAAIPRSYTFARALSGASGEVYAVAFNPKDQTVVAGGIGSKQHFWEPSTGQPLGSLDQEDVYCLAFNADGSVLASGGLHTALRLWNGGKDFIGQLGSTYKQATLWGDDSVYGIAFSPNGQLLAWGDTTQPKQGQEGLQFKVTVRDLTHNRDVTTLTGREAMSLSFTPDGSELVAAGSTGVVAWSSETWKENYAIPLKPQALAISPDSRLLAVGGEDKTVTILEARAGQKVSTLTGINGKVRALAFSPDGSMLAAGAWGEARIWRTKDWTISQVLPHQATAGSIGSGVNSVAFSRDGRWLATGGQDKVHVRLWQANN